MGLAITAWLSRHLERKDDKVESFDLILNVYTDVDNRERAKARERKKTKRHISLQEQDSGGEKMRNTSDQQGENERQ